MGIGQAHHLWCSPPSVLYLMKQPDLLLLLLLSDSCSLSVLLQISSFPVFLRLSWRLVLYKQTHEGPRRARRRDVGLFAFVAPVREKVFLRGTQRSGAQRRDHKTNIYPPASSAWALFLSSVDVEQEDGPTFGSEERERCSPQIQRGLTLDYDCFFRLLIDTVNASATTKLIT